MFFSLKSQILLPHMIFFKLIYLFLAVLLFVAACGLSLVAAGGGYSSLWCAGFSLRWLQLLRSMGSGHTGFSSCGAWALVAPQHVESFQTRAQTRAPYIGRWILNHCATKEVPTLQALKITLNSIISSQLKFINVFLQP